MAGVLAAFPAPDSVRSWLKEVVRERESRTPNTLLWHTRAHTHTLRKVRYQERFHRKRRLRPRSWKVRKNPRGITSRGSDSPGMQVCNPSYLGEQRDRDFLDGLGNLVKQ